MIKRELNTIDADTRHYFSEAKALYLASISDYVAEFECSTSFEDLAKVSYEAFKGTELEQNFPPSFSMEIIHFCSDKEKHLDFSLSYGVNLRNNIFNIPRFTVKRAKSLESATLKSAKWFGLHDYFTFRDIASEVRSRTIVNNPETALHETKAFIDDISFMLRQDDIQHILSTPEWLDVPHDKSDYF